MLQKIRNFLFINTTTKQTIAKNTTWLFFGEVTNRIFKAGLTIIAARIIGAAGFGLFSYTLALAGIFMFFEDAGIGVFLTRELAKSNEEKVRLLATATILKLILLISAVLLFILIGPHIATLPGSSLIIPVVALIILFDSLREFSFLISRAQQKMQVESLVKFLTSFFMLFFGLWFVLMKPTPLSLAWGYALGSFLGFVTIFVSVRKNFQNPFIFFSKALIKPIWRAAWPFSVIIISNLIIFNTDTLFLGYYTSAEVVGSYAAAQRLIQICYLVSSMVATAVFPVFAQKTARADEYRSAIEKSFGVLLNLAIPIIIGTILWAPALVRLLFGMQYAAAALSLQILALGLLPLYISAIYSNAVFALDQQKRFVVAQVIGIILNVCLDIILIPKLQGAGAAIASTVAVSVITFIMTMRFKLLINYSMLRYVQVLYILAAILVMVGFSYVLQLIHVSVIIGLPISVLVYAFTIFLTHRNFIKTSGFL